MDICTQRFLLALFQTRCLISPGPGILRLMMRVGKRVSFSDVQFHAQLARHWLGIPVLAAGLEIGQLEALDSASRAPTGLAMSIIPAAERETTVRGHVSQEITIQMRGNQPCWSAISATRIQSALWM